MIKLLIGLGNPGREYEKTRHNIGFMAIDEIAKRYNSQGFTKKFHAEYGSIQIAGEKIILLKPMTFMNLSGKSAIEAVNFFKISLDDMYVIYDEIDLPLAKIRVKKAGGSGGHNGIKSLDQYLGNDYWRLRIGIGKPLYDVSDYVLSKFHSDEEDQVNKIISNIAENIALLFEGADKFMNKITLIS